MTNLKALGYSAKAFVKHNSPAILTGIGITGAVTTAYFTGVAGYRTAKRLEDMPPMESKREVVLEVWDLYIPAAVSGLVTVACIFGANKISSNRAAAAYSLLAIGEKAFEEYKEKVVEKLGENKEQAIRDEIAQEKVLSNAPGQIIYAGGEGVLCCELLTGRYFLSDMETLKKAVNSINAKLLREDYVVVGEFYYTIGLAHTSNSSNIGWTSDKLMDLEFTTVLSNDAKPCLAFEYNYIKPL